MLFVSALVGETGIREALVMIFYLWVLCSPFLLMDYIFMKFIYKEPEELTQGTPSSQEKEPLVIIL